MIRIIFITSLILIELTSTSFGQKNILKAFIFPPIPIINNQYFGSLTLAYERNFTDKNSLSFLWNFWTAQTRYNKYFDGNLMLEFRHILIKEESKIFNNLFGGVYSIFGNREVYINGGPKKENGIEYHGNKIGLGLSLGKRIYLASNHKLLLEIGGGATVSYFIYSIYFQEGAVRVNKEPEIQLQPRIIFLFGYQF